MYGKRAKFSGQVVTLKVHNDNSLVKNALGEPGKGKVRLSAVCCLLSAVCCLLSPV
jgi:hypothetical protein